VYLVQQDEGLGGFRQVSATQPRHCCKYESISGRDSANDFQTCYDCVEEQLDVDPINDEVYDEIQDRSNAFVPDDVPFDYQPSQWTDDDKPEGSSSVSRIPGCILWNRE
jgi:hypothetical protein